MTRPAKYPGTPEERKKHSRTLYNLRQRWKMVDAGNKNVDIDHLMLCTIEEFLSLTIERK